MPGWGRSFVVAIKTVLVGVVFAILGIIIMIVGGITIYEIYTSSHNIWIAIGPGIPIIIVGLILGFLGFYAALIKFTSEETIKEMRAATSISPIQASIRSCPSCRTPLVWVEQYKRWYCPNCKQYIP